MAFGGNKFWNSKSENIADSYTVNLTGTEATAITGQAVAVPTTLYSITIVGGAGSLRVLLHDASSTGDTSLVWHGLVGATAMQTSYFPRGLKFSKGIVVSATGAALSSISLTRHDE